MFETKAKGCQKVAKELLKSQKTKIKGLALPQGHF